MAVSTCGLLGLMALAFLPRRIHAWAALTGVAASYACLLVMMFFLQVSPSVALVWAIPEGGAGVNFLLWPVVSNLVCFGVALGVDAVLPGSKARTQTQRRDTEVHGDHRANL